MGTLSESEKNNHLVGLTPECKSLCRGRYTVSPYDVQIFTISTKYNVKYSGCNNRPAYARLMYNKILDFKKTTGCDLLMTRFSYDTGPYIGPYTKTAHILKSENEFEIKGWITSQYDALDEEFKHKPRSYNAYSVFVFKLDKINKIVPGDSDDDPMNLTT